MPVRVTPVEKDHWFRLDRRPTPDPGNHKVRWEQSIARQQHIEPIRCPSAPTISISESLFEFIASRVSTFIREANSPAKAARIKIDTITTMMAMPCCFEWRRVIFIEAGIRFADSIRCRQAAGSVRHWRVGRRVEEHRRLVREAFALRHNGTTCEGSATVFSTRASPCARLRIDRGSPGPR